MLNCMQSTSVRIDTQTHQELKRMADDLHLSVGETVRYAVRRLHQEQMGSQLNAALTEQEVAWLDADLG
jgi:Arc/MetJ-type ribon-helix-helix transcriptional regulator